MVLNNSNPQDKMNGVSIDKENSENIIKTLRESNLIHEYYKIEQLGNRVVIPVTDINRSMNVINDPNAVQIFRVFSLNSQIEVDQVPSHVDVEPIYRDRTEEIMEQFQGKSFEEISEIKDKGGQIYYHLKTINVECKQLDLHLGEKIGYSSSSRWYQREVRVPNKGKYREKFRCESCYENVTITTTTKNQFIKKDMWEGIAVLFLGSLFSFYLRTIWIGLAIIGFILTLSFVLHLLEYKEARFGRVESGHYVKSDKAIKEKYKR